MHGGSIEAAQVNSRLKFSVYLESGFAIRLLDRNADSAPRFAVPEVAYSGDPDR
jgi:hypothetical protein